ncbi:antimicrobial peptide NK-lysin isoform X2 [Pangasianodon hypophthalmus]|uniref:antimicrobial peptide NK-lysin isoform X2 n=1 Tax=Pangasianodon hypophthalmus TaxID=310915 RepID=UPI00147DD93F|nr:antimicrobial peptide NK-lysin isoform X2 [Pangasianodon hypophthalmus]
MFWNLLIASFFIGSACAMHLEYLKVDSAEELLVGTLDEDLPMPEEQLPGVCWICKWVMKKVKKHLGNRENAEQIKEKLKRGCDKIGFLKDQCKKIVDKNIDILVEELSTDDDPKTICANIGVCKSVGMLELIQGFPQIYQKL